MDHLQDFEAFEMTALHPTGGIRLAKLVGYLLERIEDLEAEVRVLKAPIEAPAKETLSLKKQ